MMSLKEVVINSRRLFILSYNNPSFKDAAGQRSYEVIIDDTLIKTNIGFINNYMKHEYRDELYKYVALESNDENSGIPVRLDYVDELWSKINNWGLIVEDPPGTGKSQTIANILVHLSAKGKKCYL
jgi:hypothetical protein